MIKKEGKYPCNARVDVDYTKKKPRVDFSYPDKNPKKDAINQASNIWTVLLILLLVFCAPFYILYLNDGESYFPESCSKLALKEYHYDKEVKYSGDINSSMNYNYSYDAVYGFNLTCDNYTYEFSINSYPRWFEKNHFIQKNVNDNKKFWIYILLILWMLAGYRGSYFLSKQLNKYLIKKKWYQKWLPKANADGVLIKKRNKRYAKFYPKDIFENTIVIPKFNNVELDYKTSGDFSDKLRKIRIREYRTQDINIKTKKKSKIKVDKFKWYAVFTFKEKPKNGYLEVIYQ